MSTDSRTSVTVLGLGPMGQALAGAFLRGGHPTTVWNRTPGRADRLMAQGVRQAETAAAAIEAGRLVIACVIDYAAVHAVIGAAAGALSGRTLVNLTSDTPEQARSAAAWAADHGIGYLDGAIMTPTPTIGGPDAVVLYSGDEQVYRRHRPALSRLGGTAVHVGPDPGRAAAYDVALLDLFWTAMSGLVHAFALATAEGIPAGELAPFAKGIGDLMPDIIDEFAEHVDDGRFPGDQSNIRSAAAGMEHIVGAARARGIDPAVPAAALGLARRAVERGHGDEAFSRLTEVLRDGEPR